MTSKLIETTGYWNALVAQPQRWLDRTCLGIALYRPDGSLVGFKCDLMDRAIARGDLGEWAHRLGLIGAPPTLEEMVEALASNGNQMSVIQWTELHPVVGSACTVDTLNDLYAGAVEADVV